VPHSPAQGRFKTSVSNLTNRARISSDLVVSRCRRVQGLLEPRCRSRRAKDSERLNTGRRLHGQPYFPADSHPGYVFCRALPVRIGAPALQSVWRKVHAAATGDEAAAGETPSVSAGRSDGEHTSLIGHSGLAL
jgi:hypothetical protein